jgi:hypothetical protein
MEIAGAPRLDSPAGWFQVTKILDGFGIEPWESPSPTPTGIFCSLSLVSLDMVAIQPKSSEIATRGFRRRFAWEACGIEQILPYQGNATT